MCPKPAVVRATERPWTERSHGRRFAHRRRKLGAGGALGCSLYELQPGKRAFPLHYHCANTEAIWVISGTAVVRTGDEELEAGPET